MITRVQYNTVRPAPELAPAIALQFLLLAAISSVAGLGAAGWLTGAGYAVALWTLLVAAMRRARSASLGPADLVTLARAMLVGGVTALVADRFGGAPPLVLFVALASVALVLDAVDGRVARRTATTSAFGARFDMEVDAFLILVLSVQAAPTHGWWVLSIGAMRYLFVAAAWLSPWLRAPLPASLARKTIAAVQGIVLVAASVLPALAGSALIAGALALLTWSFGRDVHSLAIHRTGDDSHDPVCRVPVRRPGSLPWYPTRTRPPSR